MQRNAYKKRMKHYDDVLTGRRWWSHIYMKYLWRTDDNAIAREVLAMIPDDFRGKILDVPVGTAVFTAEKYCRMPDAEIVGLDYSQEMLAIAGERASQMQLRNLRLEQGDVGKLPYPDELRLCLVDERFPRLSRQAESVCRNFPRVEGGRSFLRMFLHHGAASVCRPFCTPRTRPQRAVRAAPPYPNRSRRPASLPLWR